MHKRPIVYPSLLGGKTVFVDLDLGRTATWQFLSYAFCTTPLVGVFLFLQNASRMARSILVCSGFGGVFATIFVRQK